MGKLLEKINGPQDLKALSEPELEALAKEIRELLLHTVSQTGGHLAPNLGVVELTLALHAIFDSPRDQIVWDVGHQAYIHKMVTGRWDRFETLRQYKGLSGFPKPEESEHDIFGTGHSSTSISAAVGLAKARDLKGEKHKVIAVIGDGSMTGGMAFEALNHLGQLQTDLIIVLNDNEMSISKNVGALSRYLTRLKLSPRLRKIKAEVEEMLHRIPRVGKVTVQYLRKFEDALNYLVIPGMLFEDLGITYVGPIDGHNIADLKESFAHVKALNKPVLVHVLTVKGKGYPLAEVNPQKFHGTGPFQVATGRKIESSKAVTYTEVVGKTLVNLAKQDERIIAVTAAMADGTGLLDFAKQLPERFIDVGIAEEHAVTMAAGMAKKGFRPVVCIYSTFLQRAYDQILHDVCLQNLPVLFMLDRAGLVGQDGPTHHGVFDLSYLRHIPNLTLMAPKDEAELKDMIFTALHHDGPVAIRYPKRDGMGIRYNTPYQQLAIGRGEIARFGEKVALIAIGSMVNTALEAAKRLESDGISCTVMNARFAKPLDEALLYKLAITHQHLITIEENVAAGGFGTAVLEYLNRQNLPNLSVKILGIPDQFVPHGSNDQLLRDCGLDAESIVKVVRGLDIPLTCMSVRI
ncbi:MAG TPA: 1-deoxy-D-xylulose-5-phosphate synthase [Bacillota bacterium]|nr:1-deoxy-D-xylulose-5-phosphate synthase [Bacillota bacterium]